MLQDFATAGLIARLEENFQEERAYLCRHPPAELHDEADCLWFVTGVPILGFNGVLRSTFAGADTGARVLGALGRLDAHEVPMLWYVGPSTRPADLGQRLEALGLPHVADVPGMALDLRALNEDLSISPGLRVDVVGDRETLRRWSAAYCAGNELPGGVGDALFNLLAPLGVDRHAPLRHYLAVRDGEPVATASLFLGTRTAGVYYVSTIPSARRQGIGTAATLWPLREARARGYRVAILQASPMAVNLYRRLGFQEYCKFGVYYKPVRHSAGR